MYRIAARAANIAMTTTVARGTRNSYYTLHSLPLPFPFRSPALLSPPHLLRSGPTPLLSLSHSSSSSALLNVTLFKISTTHWAEFGKIVLHICKFVLHTLCSKTHYFRPWWPASVVQLWPLLWPFFPWPELYPSPYLKLIQTVNDEEGVVGQPTWGPRGLGLEQAIAWIYSDLFPIWQVANEIAKP